MDRYRKFVLTSLQKMFPDDWASVMPSPSPFSIRALLLGFRYLPELSFILRPSFYDLARTPPFSVSEGNDNSSKSSGSVTLASLDLSHVKPDLFLCLMNAQRHLVRVWDQIPGLLRHDCSQHTCNLLHQGTTIYQTAKNTFLFDPILGIGKIIADISSSKSYCETAKKQVYKNLVSHAATIWADLKTFGGIP